MNYHIVPQKKHIQQDQRKNEFCGFLFSTYKSTEKKIFQSQKTQYTCGAWNLSVLFNVQNTFF